VDSFNWHLMPDDELNDNKDALEMRQIDYYNSFFSNDGNRRVLFDLYKYIQTRFPDGQEYALANLALEEIYKLIKHNAGINENDIINACVGILSERK